MATYSTNLKLTLIATGDESGTWGTTTNTNLGTLLEQAITGVVDITMADANYTLTVANGATDESRNANIKITSFVTLTTSQQNTMWVATAAATPIQTGYASANVYILYIMHGSVSIGTGGTFIPQSTMTTAQGSYITQIGSYIRLREVGQAGSNSSSGTWA